VTIYLRECRSVESEGERKRTSVAEKRLPMNSAKTLARREEWVSGPNPLVPEIFGTCLVSVNLDQRIRSSGPDCITYINQKKKIICPPASFPAFLPINIKLFCIRDATPSRFTLSLSLIAIYLSLSLVIITIYLAPSHYRSMEVRVYHSKS
jgi:hypothetical protein